MFSLLILIILLFVISSCAVKQQEQEEDTTSTTKIDSLSDLEGTWVTDCELQGEWGFYAKRSIQFSETGFVAESSFYEDSSCLGIEHASNAPLYSSKLIFTNLTVEESWDNLGLKFTGSVQSYTRTSTFYDWTFNFNSNLDTGCGITDWQTNVPREILGTSCTNIEKGDVLTNWYKVTENYLVLGNEWSDEINPFFPSLPSDINGYGGKTYIKQ